MASGCIFKSITIELAKDVGAAGASQGLLGFSRFSDNFLANHRRRSRSTAGLVFLDHILFKVEAKFYFCKKQVINRSASMIS